MSELLADIQLILDFLFQNIFRATCLAMIIMLMIHFGLLLRKKWK